jgi:hypothetical protein
MYLHMLVFGVLLVIVGLWLLGETDDIYEGLADTSKLVMASLISNNIYYADIGLGNSPNWTSIGGSYKQMSASVGRIIAVNTSNQAYYGTKYDLSGALFNWVQIPGSVSQVSFNYPMVAGRTPQNTIVYIENVTANPTTAMWKAVGGTQASKTFNYITISQGAAIGAGTDNQLWYCPDIRTPAWINISTALLAGIAVKNISFDGGDVAVIDTSNRVYFANKNISTAPNWTSLTSQALTVISIRNHMGLGLGTNGALYFSGDVGGNSWFSISGPPGGSTWPELFYPATGDMLTYRPATTTATGTYRCNSNENLINGVCVSKCPDGSYPDGELCSSQAVIAPFSTPNDIKCTPSNFLSGKRWLCDSQKDMTSLLTTAPKNTSYVSRKDQVCVTESTTTKMYYCVTGAEAMADVDALKTIKLDFGKTCNSITKNYTDLSNNLTNLIKIQNGMRSGGASLGTASDSLNSIYRQMSCDGSSGAKATLCTQIQSAAASVRTNSSDVTTTLSTVIPSLTTALGTRDSLLVYKSKFQCP